VDVFVLTRNVVRILWNWRIVNSPTIFILILMQVCKFVKKLFGRKLWIILFKMQAKFH